jgi:hypothetical protein
MASRFSFSIAAVLGVALLSGAAAITPASAATYDLQTDWSDASNPNGSWSYREDNTPLIQHPNWSGFGPAWSNGTSGVTTPMLLQYDGVGSESIDAVSGNIIGHTANASTSLNIRFTSPTAGTATISGNIWDAHTSVDRDQVWQLLVNNVVQDTGVVLGDGTNGSSAPDSFSLVIALALNDVVDLRSFRQIGESFGGLLGYNMTIDIAPAVPVPAALPLFASGLGMLAWATSRRRRKTAAA